MNTGNINCLLILLEEAADYVSYNHEYSYYYDLKTIDKQGLLVKAFLTLHVFDLFLLIPKTLTCKIRSDKKK